MAESKRRQQQEDAELRAELASYGETVGPITGSVVRGIYQKKLEKLKAGKVTKQAATPAGKRRSSPARSNRATPIKVGVATVTVNPAAETSKKAIASRHSTSTSSRAKPPSPQRSPISSRTRRSAGVGLSHVTFSPDVKPASSNPLPSASIAVADSGSHEQINASSDRSSRRDPVFSRKLQELTRRSLKCYDDTKSLSDVYTRSPRTFDRGEAKRSSRIRSEFSDEDDVLSQHHSVSQTSREYASLRPSRRSLQSYKRKSTHFSSSRCDPIDDSLDGKPQLFQRRSDGDMDEELTPQFLRPRDLVIDFLCNQYTIVCATISVLALLVWLLLLWKIPTMLPLGQDSPDSASVVKDPAYQDGLKYLRCLYKELSERNGLVSCGMSGVTTRFNGIELVEFAKQCIDEKVEGSGLVLNGLKAAILEYPKQFIIKRNNNDVNMLTDLVPLDTSLYVTTENVAKPVACRLRQSMSVVIMRICIAAAVVLVGIFVYLFVKRRWMIDDEETRLMFMLVEKIIDALRQHRDLCQQDKSLPPYLPIVHVRDLLISPSQRKTMSRVWNKAVHFLSSTDSRIRVETQIISGEEFDVWRWIGVPTTAIKLTNRANHLAPESIIEKDRTWQGPAFDEIEKVVRLPIVTPTPCLKIRFMHSGTEEIEEHWDLQVRDALLEKCTEDGAKVLHIYVDKTSKEGCVYVKCDCLDSAGKAFRSIYGNWFDGRLVIVKFVTLTRYHQRFPEALDANQELYPSGAFPFSIVPSRKPL